MYKVIFLDKAIENIQDITSFISLDNPFQAKKVLDSIYSSISYLEMFPYLGKERKDGLREIVSKRKYRVFYKVGDNTVIIISIFKYQDIF